MGGQQSTVLPYDIGEKKEGYKSKTWELYTATNKEDSSRVSVFKFEKPSDVVPAHVENCIRRLKTLRHPNLLRFIDSLTIDNSVFVVTEEVWPLTKSAIQELKEYPEAISWGLYRIGKGLSFLHNDCNTQHGNVCFSSIFLTKSGDWKLGDPLLSFPFGSEGSNFYSQQHVHVSDIYKPPEVLSQISQGGGISFDRSPNWGLDSWMFGCLIYEVFQPSPLTVSPATDKSALKSAKIPSALMPQFKEMFSSNPNHRPNFSKVLESSYFQNNYVQTGLFLESMALKDSFEKDHFFRKLSMHLDSFPKPFNKYKVLPHLVEALDFGAANSRVLGPLLKIGTQLTPEEYGQLVTPSVAKWFASRDKNLRINLLQNLEHFAEHLTPEMVNDDIFAKVATGFQDPDPKMRELTLRSLLFLVPKMSEANINNQVMRSLAKLQVDPVPGIRANTTICLGKISSHLSPATKHKVLVAAFTRALRDPYPPARIAGLSAFMATSEDYSPATTAQDILPHVVSLTVDGEKSVREKAFLCSKVFLKRLEDVHNGVVTKPSTATQKKEAAGMLAWAWKMVSNENQQNGEGGGDSSGDSTTAGKGVSGGGEVSSVTPETIKEPRDQREGRGQTESFSTQPHTSSRSTRKSQEDRIARSKKRDDPPAPVVTTSGSAKKESKKMGVSKGTSSGWGDFAADEDENQKDDDEGWDDFQDEDGGDNDSSLYYKPPPSSSGRGGKDKSSRASTKTTTTTKTSGGGFGGSSFDDDDDDWSGGLMKPKPSTPKFSSNSISQKGKNTTSSGGKKGGGLSSLGAWDAGDGGDGWGNDGDADFGDDFGADEGSFENNTSASSSFGKSSSHKEEKKKKGSSLGGGWEDDLGGGGGGGGGSGWGDDDDGLGGDDAGGGGGWGDAGVDDGGGWGDAGADDFGDDGWGDGGGDGGDDDWGMGKGASAKVSKMEMKKNKRKGKDA